MPLPLTVSCFSKIQIGSTFLVPAHLGSPGKRAVKWMCVCVYVYNNNKQLSGLITGGNCHSVPDWNNLSTLHKQLVMVYQRDHWVDDIRYSLCKNSIFQTAFQIGNIIKQTISSNLPLNHSSFYHVQETFFVLLKKPFPHLHVWNSNSIPGNIMY